MQKYKYDILGIGNAVTDIFVEVEDSFLIKNDLVEGTMKLVEDTQKKIYNFTHLLCLGHKAEATGKQARKILLTRC